MSCLGFVIIFNGQQANRAGVQATHLEGQDPSLEAFVAQLAQISNGLN